MAPPVFWYGAPSLRRGLIWEESTELPWGGGADSKSGAEAEYSVVQRVGVGYGSEARYSGAQEAGTGAKAGFLKAGEVGAEAGTCDLSLDAIEGAGIPEIYGKGGIPGMGGGRAPPQLHWGGRAAGGKAPGAGGGGAGGGSPGARGRRAASGAGGGGNTSKGSQPFFSSVCFSSAVSDILKTLVPRGFVIPVQQEAYSLSSG